MKLLRDTIANEIKYHAKLKSTNSEYKEGFLCGLEHAKFLIEERIFIDYQTVKEESKLQK